MRRIFSTVFGPHEPALTVGSLAISATGRPSTVADAGHDAVGAEPVLLPVREQRLLGEASPRRAAARRARARRACPARAPSRDGARGRRRARARPRPRARLAASGLRLARAHRRWPRRGRWWRRWRPRPPRGRRARAARGRGRAPARTGARRCGTGTAPGRSDRNAARTAPLAPEAAQTTVQITNGVSAPPACCTSGGAARRGARPARRA